MTTAIAAYAGTFLIFLALDAVWLGVVAAKFYRRQLGDLMLASPRFGVAAIFYIAFAATAVILAVMPALNVQSLATAAIHGAVLGFAAYGTYDMTNLATLRGWPLTMSVVDMIWGTVLTTLSASGGFLVARFFS